MKTRSLAFLLSFMFILLIGCSSVPDFDQTAYRQSLSIKSDALNLMVKANEPYGDHLAEIDSLKNNVESAYQHAKTISNNDETISQWEIIRDPNRSSLFGFLERWKAKNTLSDSFITQVKYLIASDFNEMIDYENHKRKP